MPPRLPSLLHLRPAWLDRADAIGVHVDAVLRPRPCWRAFVVHVFAVHHDELAFARALLARHTGWWVGRSNQRRSCGDFVVVDPSPPRPDHRRVWVVELKRGAELREGGGSAGFQLRLADAAVDEWVRRGIVGPRVRAQRLSGDPAEVLRHLEPRGYEPPWSSALPASS